MDHVALLKELQGDLSLREFADLIGVAHSSIGMVLTEDRRPGRKFVDGLVRAFPARRAEILDVFFPENVLNCVHASADEDVLDEPEAEG